MRRLFRVFGALALLAAPFTVPTPADGQTVKEPLECATEPPHSGSIAAALASDPAATVQYGPVLLNDGEDAVHWASELLDAVGVDSEDHSARLIYAFHCLADGFWVNLTASEAQDANVFLNSRPTGYASGGASFNVSIPRLGEDGAFGALVPFDAALYSPQRTPAWLERVGWNDIQVNPSRNAFVTVAIADTGIDTQHADLTDTVQTGYDCTHERPDRWRSDPHGHGTHVWGTFAAHDDDAWIEGAVPGVTGVSVPVLDGGGSGSSASVACGLDMAAALGADLVNFSLGGFSPPSECGGMDASHNLFCRAVDAGIIVVVAAGNDASDAYWQAPANYEEVVTVGAMAAYADGLPPPGGGCSFGTPDNSYATFTSFGPVVDVVAPGVCNESTIPGNGILAASGTSMAAPAAGTVFVEYRSRCGEFRPEGGGRRNVVDEVLDFSEEWMDGEGAYNWPFGPEIPPLIHFGAECAGGRTR